MSKYKCCCVPQCQSNSNTTPDKTFVTVPIRNRERKKWFNAMRQDTIVQTAANKGVFFVCEDHFDLERDATNLGYIKLFRQQEQKSAGKRHPRALKKRKIEEPDIVIKLLSSADKAVPGPSSFPEEPTDISEEPTDISEELVSLPTQEIACVIKQEVEDITEEGETGIHNIVVKEEGEVNFSDNEAGSSLDARQKETKSCSTNRSAKTTIGRRVKASLCSIQPGTSNAPCDNNSSTYFHSVLGCESVNLATPTKAESTKHTTVINTDIKEVDVKRKPFVCTFCNYASIKNCNLRTHIKAVHMKEKTFSCTLCKYTAVQNSTLQTHIKAVHMKEKAYNCTMCHYSAAKTFNLLRHIKAVHIKEKAYTCYFCSYSTVQKSHLQIHMKSIHLKEKPYACSLCDYTAMRDKTVRRHFEAVHIREKVFTCSFCNYTALHNNTLRAHIKTVHMKRKDYACTFCSYAAATNSNLKRHVQAMHTKDKVYTCSLCDYSAALSCYLMNHVNTVH